MWQEEAIKVVNELYDKFKNIQNNPFRNDGLVDLNQIDEINFTLNSISSIKTTMIEVLNKIEKIEADCAEEQKKYLDNITAEMAKRGFKINPDYYSNKTLDTSVKPVIAIDNTIKTHDEDAGANTAVSNNDTTPMNAENEWKLVSSKKKRTISPDSAWNNPLKIDARGARDAIANGVVAQSHSQSASPVSQASHISILKRGKMDYTVENVHIIGNLYIPGVRVVNDLPSMRDIMNNCDPGFLYYSKNADQFFIIMMPGNILLYGNIGNITPPIDSPSKVKDCKFNPCRHETCDFYHDPFKHPGRTDRRNYITGAWEYTGHMAGQRRQGEQSRIVGSYEYLEFDLEFVDIRNVEMYRSQIMHDLLVHAICTMRV